MNFLFFSAQYLPTVGGVERYTYNLAWQLIKRGHKVTVVTSSLEDMPSKEVDDIGIEIYRIPVLWIMRHRFPLIRHNRRFKRLVSDLNKNSFDVALIQTRFYLNSLWAAGYCKKRKIPSMVIEHGTAYLIRDGLVGFAGKIYEHIAAWYVKSKCDKFYGVSQACCDWLKNFGINAVGCIYNAVDLQDIYDKVSNGERSISDKINFEGKKNICFTGRFVKEKGVDVLVEAFDKIRMEMPDVQLIMVGDGPMFEQISLKKVPNLVLTGRLSHEETLAVVKKCDVFCLPTFSEGFSTAVLEAAALKTAIITTPTGGSVQLIKNEKYGIIIPSMAEEEIYKALKYILENPEYIEDRVQNAYSSLCADFTWEKVSENFLGECEKLI